MIFIILKVIKTSYKDYYKKSYKTQTIKIQSSVI